ncbi:MAG: hypothetical protein ACTSSG_10500 [Candidatus Heimdallarchaeaceae archaeon]
MSKKEETKKEFAKQVVKGVIGALILIILLVIWFTWEGIYKSFYRTFPNAKEGTLLIIWLVFLFPLIGCGTALAISGGWKAYRLAVPAKEKE